MSQPHFGISVRVKPTLPKSGKLESSGTLENLELEFRGQISSHSNVRYVIGNVLKCRCPKWPRLSHLDINSPSYGQKKGRESNWHFDSWPLKVMNRDLFPTFAAGVRHGVGKLLTRATTLVQTSSWFELGARSYERPKSRESKPGQFRDSTLGVPGKRAIWM
jgi:hypothetical protein